MLHLLAFSLLVTIPNKLITFNTLLMHMRNNRTDKDKDLIGQTKSYLLRQNTHLQINRIHGCQNPELDPMIL